MAYTVQQR